MRIRKLLLTGLLIVSTTAFAQSQDQIDAFGVAWGEYQDAMATDDAQSRITSSKKVLEVGQSFLDPSDERLPLLMINYGVALRDGGQQDSARDVLTAALELAEAIHGEDSTRLVPILTQLAKADRSHDARDRHRYYRRAIAIVAANDGKDSNSYSATLLKAGISLYGTEKWNAGRGYLEEAYDHNRASLGDDHFQTGLTAYNLGKYAYYQRKNQAATEYLEAALHGFSGDSDESVQFQLHARALLVAVLEMRGKSDEATEHCVAIGQLSKLRGDQDYLPLFREAPRYPANMLAKRNEGFVEISFTVDESGFVRDPEVINKGPGDRGFEAAALAAVGRFRYAPKFENGKPTAVEGVKTRITFELEN